MIYIFDRIKKGITMAQGIKMEANCLSTARRRAYKQNFKLNPEDKGNTILKLTSSKENQTFYESQIDRFQVKEDE